MKLVKRASKVAAMASGETMIELVLTDLYQFAKRIAGDQIKLWYVKKSARKLKAHVHKIRQVKTLWQVDKAVDLKEFYCDSHLLINKKRILVRSVEDIGERKRILITGIAGQGKSIFLRYLCSNALFLGKCVPVFIELRRILEGETLLDHIQQFLEVIGIPDLKVELVKNLLNSGKVILFLDGFDEVSDSEKSRMVREIEQIAMTNDELRLIITSRPESGLEASPLLEVIQLSDLKNGEYKAVIRKLSEDTAFADNLIKQVEAHKSRLKDLLCTPLLVTLLVMSYKSFQELPEQLSEFYDSIFQVLLQRHDGAKPGFKRPRRCQFNDNQYRSVFESLCFESKRKSKSIFSYDDVHGFAESALDKNHLVADPDKYIEDIVKVTCLILREGDDYRYIHKSVQEYYAAAFVKHRSEPVTKRFYEQMILQGPYGSWQQELLFLSEIDKYRYSRHFLLPYLCSILNCNLDNVPDQVPVVDKNHAGKILGDIILGFSPSKSPNLQFLRWNKNIRSSQADDFITMDFSSVSDALRHDKITPNKNLVVDNPFRDDIKMDYVNILQVLDAGLMIPEIVIIAQKMVDNAFTLARKALELITQEETMDLGLQIDIE